MNKYILLPLFVAFACSTMPTNKKISQAFMLKRGDLLSCYKSELARGERFETEVVFSFRVSSNKKATEAKIMESKTPISTEFEKCLLGYVEGMEFHDMKVGENGIEAVQPIYFRPPRMGSQEEKEELEEEKQEELEEQEEMEAQEQADVEEMEVSGEEEMSTEADSIEDDDDLFLEEDGDEDFEL